MDAGPTRLVSPRLHVFAEGQKNTPPGGEFGKLPVLISVPHGGVRIPQELTNRICLEAQDILNDSDAFEQEVYDLGDRVAAVISTDIGRAFVDVNRAPDDLPPENPDGAIKTYTCYRRVIYKKAQQPDRALVELLLKNYHEPYHLQVQAALHMSKPKIKLGLDCHTMSDEGPAIGPDPGMKRPLLCLGNAYGRTCSQETIDRLADCFVQAFGFEPSEVTQNEPFAGAYITQTYGGRPVPWVQVEMNQSLYLKPKSLNAGVLDVDPIRVRAVKHRFERALAGFFGIR